jgi:CBS domain-containing protein
MIKAALAGLLALIFMPPPQTLRVGFKNVTEQHILAKMYAAALEANGFQADHKINLDGTPIAPKRLSLVAARDIMRNDAEISTRAAIPANASLREALSEMLAGGHDALAVMEDGRRVGLVSLEAIRNRLGTG